MSTIVDIKIPHEQLSLEADRSPVRGVPAYLTAAILTEEAAVVHLFATSEDARSLERALETYPEARSVERIDTGTGYCSVHATLTDHLGDFFAPLADVGADVLEGVQNEESWLVRVRFPDAEAVRTASERYAREEFEVSINRLYVPRSADVRERYGLTPEQHDLLRRAHEEGYFEVPRETSVAELSEETDVSDTAVSRHLRQGLDALVEHTLCGDAELNVPRS